MLLSEFLNNGVSSLETLYPTQEARSIMFMLCESRLGTKNYTHIVEPKFEIDPEKLDLIQNDLARLSKGEPIQYILGRAEFYGLMFNVAPGVLIPRGETELLVERAISLARDILKQKSSVNILDICTGSGCIAWSLALNVPEATVTALDISDTALSIAQGQPFSEELLKRGAKAPSFVKADILDFSNISKFEKYDLILSNPPYIMESEKAQMRTNVLDYEPDLALFVSDADPLIFYRAIAKWSDSLLLDGGCCLSEINETLGEKTRLVFADAGFGKTEVVKDYFNKDRFVQYAR